MPELPEVETIRRDLDRLFTGDTIQQIKIIDDRILTGFRTGGGPRRKVSEKAFTDSVRNKKVRRFLRRGKYLNEARLFFISG